MPNSTAAAHNNPGCSIRADCNPLWTAPAVPVSHATEARRRMRRYESKANGSSLQRPSRLARKANRSSR
ncbi:hypothetical protein FW320_15580 [Azospirillum sp. Vi22]|nr:hypothetical protein [Azospirillum baldaniorum]